MLQKAGNITKTVLLSGYMYYCSDSAPDIDSMLTVISAVYPQDKQQYMCKGGGTS